MRRSKERNPDGFNGGFIDNYTLLVHQRVEEGVLSISKSIYGLLVLAITGFAHWQLNASRFEKMDNACMCTTESLCQ